MLARVSPAIVPIYLFVACHWGPDDAAEGWHRLSKAQQLQRIHACSSKEWRRGAGGRLPIKMNKEEHYMRQSGIR